MTGDARPEGKQLWVPLGAYIVYPSADVQEMFGHDDAGSTRKMMTTVHGYPMIKGWTVEEVEYVLKARDPKLVEAWRLRKLRQAEPDAKMLKAVAQHRRSK